MYQLLFYFFEWVSCFHKSLKAGISRSTQAALPLVKEVIPCGVPLDRYRPSDKKTEKPSILFVGDLNSRKRGKYLLKIFNNDILKEHPECILSVVGPQPCDGTNVKYLGNLSEEELITEYQKAWVYCMASSYEGFGVPVIEAMACGTAVAAVSNPGIKEIIRHDYNGLLLDDAELSKGISRVLSDSNLRKTFENNGLSTVEKKFNINTTATEYERLYHLLLDR
jgi:glycosyltransferase involved in cell wall biosynthesis